LSLTGVLSRHGDLVNSVEFMPDGKRLLTASDDGTALVFDCGLACATPDQVISEARARDSARTPSG
jgi:WD40 repeat protein